MQRATNASSMKEQNRRLILSLINSGEHSRADISRATGLTKAAVTMIVDELIQNGYVSEYECNHTGIGRKPLYLKLNSDSAYAIGINITRHHYEVGIINLCGEVLCEERQRIANPKTTINSILKILNEQIKKHGIDNGKILGTGITTPGPVDYRSNTILSPPNFEDWHNLTLDFISNIHLENIANANALCEKYFGSCADTDNYIMLIINEGIGSGIVINNKIYRGNSGKGNEIGHISIDINGKKCECGNIGCLEKYASIPSILENTSYSSWQDVIESNDITLIEKEADYLSCATATVVNLFDISTILLGGDVGYKGELIGKLLSEKLSNKVITGCELNIIPIEKKSGVLSAGCIIIDDFFTRESDIT